jgi:hypothetical protein
LEIFFVSGGRENQGYFSRIARKYVDFVLCDLASMQVLAGVELDDASHARADRQERDAFVEEVFATAGLPLLRFPVRAGYALADVAGRVAPVLKCTEAGRPVMELAIPAISQAKMPVGSADEVPFCTRCGVPMVLHTATRGDHAGEQFYGCPNYPHCQEKRRVA